jgi:malate dehydrogenase (oxaloacetate-decarboxylating)
MFQQQNVLVDPVLNKGSAFTQKERVQFELTGRLPYQVETLTQQVARCYGQFSHQTTALQKQIYLRNLYDTNEILFYRLIASYLKEMLPIIYTPTLSQAVEQFSQHYRRARGLYLTYPERRYLPEIFSKLVNVDLLVITDGEGVLGIGDQGIGGIEICISKALVYTLCAGIHPRRVLPVQIDAGTNNERLLKDPLYLGWRHSRIDESAYQDFIQQIIDCTAQHLPHVFIHWEDLARHHARDILRRYRTRVSSFNDDMQGTGSVTLAALLNATRLIKQKLSKQRIVIFGAGTAGTGIADQICHAMIQEGLTEQQARQTLWLVDRQGLLTDRSDLLEFQKPYGRVTSPIDLQTVIEQVKPTILIGCSGVYGAFTESIVRTMAHWVERPIIFPLSNPTEKVEAHPADLLNWTNGRALIATGSPFEAVLFNHQLVEITQCNNALIYPGIGLGVLVARAKQLSDQMLWRACLALNGSQNQAALLPDLDQVHEVSKQVALAVAQQARDEGLSTVEGDFKQKIEEQFWLPNYDSN